MRPDNNNYGNRVVPAKNWNLTPDGPVCMDVYLTTADIMPLLKQLYGEDVPGTDIRVLDPNWADDNLTTAALFFSNLDNLPTHIKLEMGFSG
jgi:hypothetical protein